MTLCRLCASQIQNWVAKNGFAKPKVDIVHHDNEKFQAIVTFVVNGTTFKGDGTAHTRRHAEQIAFGQICTGIVSSGKFPNFDLKFASPVQRDMRESKVHSETSGAGSGESRPDEKPADYTWADWKAKQARELEKPEKSEKNLAGSKWRKWRSSESATSIAIFVGSWAASWSRAE